MNEEPSGTPTTLPTESPDPTGDEFLEIVENDFVYSVVEPNSQFSLDVNTASYSYIRGLIMAGADVPRNSVKIEEMVNYFSYDYPEPEGEDILSVTPTLSPCPWNPETMLLTVGLKAEEIDYDSVSNNLVFLLDVSGSMNTTNKLGLMIQAFQTLADQIGPNDRISVVTYAGTDSVLLEGATGSDRDYIKTMLGNLTAGGSTAGAQGIQTAYSLAEEYFIEGGNNRVILATDGDFNVGISSIDALENLISTKRSSGVYFSILGFGYGNLQDNKLETLANAGNGNYAYIDSLMEIKKVLIDQLGGTLYTVARDAKAQVVFNPAYIESYRLLGYENKLISYEEWMDDLTDTGEIGSGLCVTACYEVFLTDREESYPESTMDEHYCKVNIRYKSPTVGEDTVMELNAYLDEDDVTYTPNDDIKFISAVIEVALLLRDSAYKSDADYSSVLTRLEGIDLSADEYKSQFVELVEILN
jgi:Ca-activated chloride channel family protein